MGREISFLADRVTALESKPSTSYTNNDTDIDTGKSLCTEKGILAEILDKASLFQYYSI